MKLLPSDPPAAGGPSRGPRDRRWEPVARFLREHPGQWFHCPYDDVSQAYAPKIRQGKFVDFRPAGAFEAGLSHGKMVMRYVGEGVDSQ